MDSNYQDRLWISLEGNDYTRFETRTGLHVATGYTRIVIGERGPYVEFVPGHLIWDSFQMPDEEKYWTEQLGKDRVFKVEWRNENQGAVKVSNQKKSVDYADDRMSLLYISPLDIYVKSELVISRQEKKKPRALSE